MDVTHGAGKIRSGMLGWATEAAGNIGFGAPVEVPLYFSLVDICGLFIVQTEW